MAAVPYFSDEAGILPGNPTLPDPSCYASFPQTDPLLPCSVKPSDVHFTVTRGKRVPHTTLLSPQNWDRGTPTSTLPGSSICPLFIRICLIGPAVTRSLKRQEVVDVHVGAFAPASSANVLPDPLPPEPPPAHDLLTFRLATGNEDKMVNLARARDYTVRPSQSVVA